MRFANTGYPISHFEFLVDVSVERATALCLHRGERETAGQHTVTEAVTGVDLVQAQIRLAQGATLRDLGLDGPAIAQPRGYAIQTRVNMETIGPDGSVRPGGGTVTVYEAPNGPGVRSDGFGYAGYRTGRVRSCSQVIVQAPDFRQTGAVIAALELGLGVSPPHTVHPQNLAHADLPRTRPYSLGLENMAAVVDDVRAAAPFVERRALAKMRGSRGRVKSSDPLGCSA